MPRKMFPRQKQTKSTTPQQAKAIKSRNQTKPATSTTKTIMMGQRSFPMSKEDLLGIIRECARKLGRIPMMKDLRAMAGIGPSRINRRCGSLGRAIREAGLETVGNGYSVDTEEILRDYAQVARKLGKLPVKGEYEAHGRHSCNPFYRRFERWQDVPMCFVKEAARYGLDKEYADVVEMAKTPQRRQMGVPAREHVFNKEPGNT